MRTLRTLFLLTTVTCAGAQVPAHAGIAFTATTRSESPGFDVGRLANATVRGWADGDLGKIEFLGEPGDTLPAGSALLTTDGGETVRFFDSVRKSCSPWLGNAVLGGSTLAPKATKTVSGLKIGLVLNEAGPEIAGLATRHYRFIIEYASTFRSSAAVARSKTELIEELWTTQDLTDPALRMWLDESTWPSGDPAAEKKIAAALAQAAGVPLKRVSTLSVRSEGGHELKTTVSLEVTKVETKAIPASIFEQPFGCVDEATSGPS